MYPPQQKAKKADELMSYLLSRSNPFSWSDTFVQIILIILQRIGHRRWANIIKKAFRQFSREPCRSMVSIVVTVQDVRIKLENSDANKYIAVVTTVR